MSPCHLVLSTPGGRRRPLVTTLTTSLHPTLSQAASFSCWSRRPVVSITSSIQLLLLLLGRPLPLLAFHIPNMNVFSRSSLRTTWPKYVNLSFNTLWTSDNSSLISAIIDVFDLYLSLTIIDVFIWCILYIYLTYNMYNIVHILRWYTLCMY